MEIVLNKEEEEAVQRYANNNKITYGEAWQRMVEAMKKGLIELASKDDVRIANETQMEKTEESRKDS